MSDEGAPELVAVVADRQLAKVIETLLERRLDAIPMRRVCHEVLLCPDHDPGAYLRGPDLLGERQTADNHGLIIFDRHGCGQEALSAEDLEADVETRLDSWRGRAVAIAIDPELEAWVWADSPHVAAELGLARSDLNAILSEHGGGPALKPCRPKEALEDALRRVRRPRSASLLAALAVKIGLDRCQDRAFAKLRRSLGEWFPPEPRGR